MPASGVGAMPAAASELLQALFEEQPRPLELVFLGAHAAHFATRDQDAPLISVVPPNGLRMPGGVLVGAVEPTGAEWAAVQSASGSGATIGADVLRLGELDVRPARWWSGARPRRVGTAPADVPSLLADIETVALPLDAPTRTAVDRLDIAIKALATLSSGIATAPELAGVPLQRAQPPVSMAHVTARVTVAARAMVGLGPGLTPSGDDVLVGALVALQHFERCGSEPARARLSALRAALIEGTWGCGGRTTAVSAALLAHARRGEGMPVLLDLVAALAPAGPRSADRAGLRRAAEAVRAVGQLTGSAMLRGVQIAAAGALQEPRATIPQ